MWMYSWPYAWWHILIVLVFLHKLFILHVHPLNFSLHSTDQDIIRINYLVQTGFDMTSLNLHNIHCLFLTSVLEWLENGISGWIRFVTKLQLLPKVYRLFGFNLYLSIPLALNYVHVCGIIHNSWSYNCWLCGFVKFVNVLITVKIVSLDFVWVK